MIDHLLVAALLAATLGLATATWYALTMPEVLLSLWQQGDEPWLDEADAPVAALRWAMGGLLVVLSFLCGFALIFLAAI